MDLDAIKLKTYIGAMGNHLTPCDKSIMRFGPVHTSDLTQTSHHKDVNASITINLPATIYQTKEYIKFDITDLEGNIGGYLGLYLGVSLLQLWDLLNFIQEWCNRKCKRSNDA